MTKTEPSTFERAVSEAAKLNYIVLRPTDRRVYDDPEELKQFLEPVAQEEGVDITSYSIGVDFEKAGKLQKRYPGISIDRILGICHNYSIGLKTDDECTKLFYRIKSDNSIPFDAILPNQKVGIASFTLVERLTP